MSHVFITSADFEAALGDEIGGDRELVAPGVLRWGGVGVPGAASPEWPDPIFARQVLPDALERRADSIKGLAHEVVEVLLASLDAEERTSCLHVICADDPLDVHRPGELKRRAELIEAAVRDELRRRRRRVFRRLRDAYEPAARLEEEPRLLAQVLLLERDRVFISVSEPVTLSCGGRWPGPFPAGRCLVAADPDAPSSAYRKLRESLAWMGRRILPGERCVDLGAAPGGWSYVALREGAVVVAVDRGEMSATLAESPSLEIVRGNAFTYEPSSAPVDWLLCDLIAEPDASLGLLETWARSRWFRRMVFHVKFKGSGDYDRATRALAILRDAGYARSRAKHLYYDRNEVTLWAEEDGAGARLEPREALLAGRDGVPASTRRRRADRGPRDRQRR